MNKNWKTTLLGLFAGIALSAGSAANNRMTNPQAPPFTVGNVLPGILVAALGVASKDHDGGL